MVEKSVSGLKGGGECCLLELGPDGAEPSESPP